MSRVMATPNPIIVNKEAGETTGNTTVSYEKERSQELWERRSGGGWSQINVHVVTGLGDVADTNGDYPVTLKPGMVYEVCAFQEGHGPRTTDPIRVACLKVFCRTFKLDGGARLLLGDEDTADQASVHACEV